MLLVVLALVGLLAYKAFEGRRGDGRAAPGQSGAARRDKDDCERTWWRAQRYSRGSLPQELARRASRYKNTIGT
jgi:hypothetical protein